MAEENKSNGLAWFLAGLGVGALVGILYAPKSGRETREDLIAGAREGTSTCAPAPVKPPNRWATWWTRARSR